jgi:two-component system NtrC family response regulator
MLFRGKEGAAEGEGSVREGEELPSLKDFKTSMEREYLQRLLRAHGKDIPKMLSVAGLSRSHLYAMLKKHGLEG